MTKADIVELIADKTDMAKKEVRDLVECVLEIMKDGLENEPCLKISGFGKFEIKQKRPRKGRNPQTGEDLVIEGRRVLT